MLWALHPSFTFEADAGSSEEISEDAADFLQSLKTLSKLAITSSAFRMLMSDILVTTREVVAEAAIEIGEVASQVQAAAADVAKTAELDNLTTEGLKGKAEESYSGIQQSVGHAHRNLGTLGDDSADQIRDIVVGRVQEVRAYFKTSTFFLFSLFRLSPKHSATQNTRQR